MANAVGVGSIPGWGTKILHTVWPKKEIKIKKNTKCILKVIVKIANK